MNIAFNQSERGSLGVEMELSIVELDSRALRCAASEVLGHLGAGHPDGEHPKAKHELFESTVEIITGICSGPAEARADLAATMAEVQAQLVPRQLELVSTGTHPFSHWHEQVVSPKPRYQQLVDDIGWPARRLSIFGTHFHVGVETGPRAIEIVRSLCYFLPAFLALSASSPFRHGFDTNMASSRTKVFEGLPTAGLPPRLGTWGEFETLMETLITAHAINTIRDVWWDVRPHPEFGTVELRMCDAMPTLREVIALAALAQALVCWLEGLIDRGEQLPGASESVVRQNKWLAARFGMDGDWIVDDRGTRQPAAAGLETLLETVGPTAQRLGCAAELDEIRAIIDAGPSYQRQRAVLEAGGSLTDVVDLVARELRTDEFGP